MLTKQRQAMLLTLIGKMSPEDQLFVHRRLSSRLDIITAQAANRDRRHRQQRSRSEMRLGERKAAKDDSTV